MPSKQFIRHQQQNAAAGFAHHILTLVIIALVAIVFLSLSGNPVIDMTDNTALIELYNWTR